MNQRGCTTLTQDYSRFGPARPVRQALLVVLLPVLIAGTPLAVAAQDTPPAASPASGPSAPASPTKPASAQRPVTDQTVTAKDVVNTPLSDLNVNKRQIPPVLTEAVEHPYDLAGMSSCARLTSAVSQLNAVLGEDLDVQKARGQALSPGGVAKTVVSMFIPFEGMIREVSGAHSEQKKMQLAIYAGIERRAFLKGVGEERGCPYPARPATAGTVARHGHTQRGRRHR